MDGLGTEIQLNKNVLDKTGKIHNSTGKDAEYKISTEGYKSSWDT
jgi:hypothetical protein